MATASSESDWAWLPKTVLYLILDKLVPLSQYVRFREVCKPWLLVALDHQKKRIELPIKQFPLLLIPTKDNSEERRSLFNVIKNKRLNFQLPVPYNKRCCGSSYGWLATIEKPMTVTLINPFSGEKINLPPLMVDLDEAYLEDGYEIDVKKVILSVDPSSCPNDYVVAAIYDGMRDLAFIKSGDKSWTYVECKLRVFSDLIFYEGHLLALKHNGGVVSIDVATYSTSNPKVKIVAPELKTLAGSSYLVESNGGNLLFVRRFFDKKDHYFQYVTSGFIVHKLVHLKGPKGKQRPKWVRIKSLGDDALFLGDNTSFSISASEFPGCQPNSIYYTDDFIDSPLPLGPRDIGLFKLKDKSIRKHYVPHPKHMPPPLWIVPQLQHSHVNLSSFGGFQ